MFTGIVRGMGSVLDIKDIPGLRTISVQLPEGTSDNLQIGASIAVDGVCLTVTKIDNSPKGCGVHFDIMEESLNRTTLGELKVGSQVNIERAARSGEEVSGHILSGHVDSTVSITEVQKDNNNHVITFLAPQEQIKYIFEKGYIALNGASLTVSSVDKASCTFKVWLIPETLRLTTFGSKTKGDTINLEIDRNTQVIVDTVNNYLDERFSSR